MNTMDAFCCWHRWWWELRRKKDEFHCTCCHVSEINPAYAMNNRPVGNLICGSNFILANRKWGGLAYKAETLKVHCYHRQWEIKKAYYCQLLFWIRRIVLETPATFLPWRLTQRLVSLSWSSSLVEPSPEEHTPLEESLESFASSRTRALSFISSLSESKILWSSLFWGATLTASVRSLRAGSSLPAAWKALALAMRIRLDF